MKLNPSPDSLGSVAFLSNDDLKDVWEQTLTNVWKNIMNESKPHIGS